MRDNRVYSYTASAAYNHNARPTHSNVPSTTCYRITRSANRDSGTTHRDCCSTNRDRQSLTYSGGRGRARSPFRAG